MSNSHAVVNFYTPLQRRLHWAVLLLIVLQYALQAPMRQAMAAVDLNMTPDLGHFLVTIVHTASGLCIAALMVWRWQLRKRFVPLAAGKLAPWRNTVARWHHVSLYVVLILMAVSGALHYYAGLEPAARWHEWGKWLLAVLIGVHIAGALSHIRDGDTVFQRMMGRGSLR